MSVSNLVSYLYNKIIPHIWDATKDRTSFVENYLKFVTKIYKV